MVDLVSARAAQRADWQIRPGHFAERYGLLVIIALGESIVAIGVGIGEVEVDLVLGLTLVVALVTTALLWWSYFDWVAARVEGHLRRLRGVERGAFARDTYTFLHYPLVAGIVLFAVAVEEITQHPTEHLEAFDRALLAVGIALVLLSFVASASRVLRRIPYLRLGAAVGVALVSVGGALAGVALLGLDAAVILAMLIAERRASRRRQAAPARP